MPRVLHRKVYAGGGKGKTETGRQRARDTGAWEGGQGRTRENGRTRGRAGPGGGSRGGEQGGEGCLANCSAPCSRWPEGGGKEEEAREQKHAKHGPYARLV